MAKVFSDIIVSLDVGTTKICALVARKKNDGSIEILGVGKAPSHGLKKGLVVDINKTVDSIKAAVQEAELVSGYPIESATIGVSGSHIRSLNSRGAIPIKHHEVRESDITHVLEAAKAVAIPEGQQVLHVLPQFYSIDGQEPVLNPTNMAGIRLEAQVHIITGSITCVQNLVTCCQMAGIKINDVVLEQLASARAVLTPDEYELGVGLLDIGGGTSDFAIYQHGSIRHTMVIPVAGNHFTNDLAVGLRTTLSEAEAVKKEYGMHGGCTNAPDRLLTVKKIYSNETQLVPQAQLVFIMQPRAQELFKLLNREIEQYRLTSLMTTGLVLTGGSSLLAGIATIAQQELKMPIRIGIPKTGTILPESLDHPLYATGYGLLLFAFDNKIHTSRDQIQSNAAFGALIRMKSWINDFF